MPRSHAHTDRPSLAAGLIVVTLGIAMLILVFSLAYHMFTQPVPGLNLTSPPKGVPPPAASIGLTLTSFLQKLLLLALLTLVGSLVASKGVHLLFAAARSHSPSREEREEQEEAVTVTKNGTLPHPIAMEEVPSENIRR